MKRMHLPKYELVRKSPYAFRHSESLENIMKWYVINENCYDHHNINIKNQIGIRNAYGSCVDTFYMTWELYIIHIYLGLFHMDAYRKRTFLIYIEKIQSRHSNDSDGVFFSPPVWRVWLNNGYKLKPGAYETRPREICLSLMANKYYTCYLLRRYR